jgi:hypothetical protein
MKVGEIIKNDGTTLVVLAIKKDKAMLFRLSDGEVIIATESKLEKQPKNNEPATYTWYSSTYKGKKMELMLEDEVSDITELEKFAISEAQYRVEKALKNRKDITSEQAKEIYFIAEQNLVNYLMYDENALNYNGIDEEVNKAFDEVIG